MSKYQILLLGLTLSLTLIWFSSGEQLATGEESFSVFNSISVVEQVSLWQRSGTGYPLPFYSTRLFPASFNVVLTKLGMPLFLTQAVFYFFILLSGSVGAFLLIKFLFKKENNSSKVALLAALFYVFNLYTLSQVFNRFLYSGILLWAYLPVFLLLWIKWTKGDKSRYLLIFLLTSVLFSLVYLQPAHLSTFWVPAGLFVLAEIWTKRKRKQEVFDLLSRSFVALAFWILVNIWWIYPYVKVGTSAFGQISDWKANFDSLVGVSQYFPTREILVLRQSFLFGENSLFFDWYRQDWVSGISLLILVIATLGWLVSRRNKNWIWLTVLAFVGWFISKGSNPPFGYEFFNFLFSNFPATAVLRNPYEKFGIVWLLPYSVFFAQGLSWIYAKFKPRLRTLVVGGVLVLSLGVLIWPMWTGDVFAKNIRVSVPEYYREANEFLNLDKTDGRILMLPIIPGDGVRYTWGYQGVEPSEFLFDRPAVSKILRTRYFDEKYQKLYEALSKTQNYNQILEEMNIKYLVLHRDYQSMFTMEDVKGAERQISSNMQVKFVKDFGELSAYQFNSPNTGKLFFAEESEAAQISYEKLSPTRYRVNVKQAKEPYTLIFKETFNELWQARIDGKKLDEHFLIYDYANGWKVEELGDYSIDIVFKVWPWE